MISHEAARDTSGGAPDGGSPPGQQRGVHVVQVADGQQLGGFARRRRCRLRRRRLERAAGKAVVRHLRCTVCTTPVTFPPLNLTCPMPCLRRTRADVLDPCWQSGSRKYAVRMVHTCCLVFMAQQARSTLVGELPPEQPCQLTVRAQRKPQHKCSSCRSCVTSGEP